MSKTSNNAKLQKWSNYDEVHGFDVKTNKNVELVANHSKQRKSTKVIKVQWIASIWCQNDKKCWVTFQTIRYKQNYKSDQITMNCIDLTLKRSKMLSYVPNHSKHSKPTKVIKLQWIASIWCQNDKKCWVTSQTIPNNAKLQKWSNYDEVHGFDVKTIKNVELRPNHSKQRKLQKLSNYNELHRFDVKTIKNVELRPKPFQNSKTTKVIKLRWIASIWRQNDKKCLVTSQTIPNTAKLQK